jgi:hypothetical protein
MERAEKRRQIAILDFIMPRLDGVEAALFCGGTARRHASLFKARIPTA